MSLVYDLFKEKDLKIININLKFKKKIDYYGSISFLTKSGLKINTEWGYGFPYKNYLEIKLKNKRYLSNYIFSKKKNDSTFLKIYESNKLKKTKKIKKNNQELKMYNDFLKMMSKNNKIKDNSSNTIVKRLEFISNIYTSYLNESL